MKSRLKAFLCLWYLSIPAQADEVRVAVAANFISPMKEIATAFEKQSGHTAVLSFASSGQLYAQILNNAPYEVFLSADQSKPLALILKGMAVPETRFTYAKGQLALWSAKPGLVDDAGRILKEATLGKLAIANPKLAPYGAAAVQTLQALKLYEPLKSHLVFGENISQTYQFASTGNADIAFVALSQIQENGQLKSGSFWRVPHALYEPISQDAILLRKGMNSPAAQQLLDFLKSDTARHIMSAYGYQVE